MANIEYACVDKGIVVERLSLRENIDLKATFSSDFLASMKKCAPAVQLGWLLKGNQFEKPVEQSLTLDAVKAARVEKLRASCEAAITGGFKSSALGDAHTYPSDIKAQINLMGSVTDSMLQDGPAKWTTPFWVCDALGIWEWKIHDRGQIQQAGRDCKAHILACQSTLSTLLNSVLNAETADNVFNLNWPTD